MQNLFKKIIALLKTIPIWHFLVWVIYLMVELYLYDKGFGKSFFQFVLRFLFMVILSYLNIFYILPKFYKGTTVFHYIKILSLVAFVFAMVYSGIVFLFDSTSCNNPNCSGHTFSIVSLLNTFISFLIFTLAFAMSDYVSKQKKRILELEMNRNHVELQLLQSQLDPHTLLNNMNTLYWKAMEYEQEDLANMVVDISDMLRYTLYETNQEYIEIYKEIEFLEKLISFQSQRGKNRVEINFENKLSNSTFLIPPLIFAPLVENCFKHAVSTLNDAIISIKIWDDNHYIYFKSNNNFDKNSFKNLHENKGIGLQNLKKRMALLYPEKQYIKVTTENNQFIVKVKIPKTKE